MRFTVMASVVGAALAITAVPAKADWHSYINRFYGFSFEAPGDLKTEKAKYTAQMAGDNNDAVIYRSIEDNIEYKVTVVDFGQRAGEGAVLLGEATFQFQNNKKLLMDTFGRVDGMYGRKLTVDQPNNGGRTLGAFYFINGHLLSLQATVLPANGDYQTLDMARFVDSLAFRPDRAESGSTDLTIPN